MKTKIIKTIYYILPTLIALSAIMAAVFFFEPVYNEYAYPMKSHLFGVVFFLICTDLAASRLFIGRYLLK